MKRVSQIQRPVIQGQRLKIGIQNRPVTIEVRELFCGEEMVLGQIVLREWVSCHELVAKAGSHWSRGIH